MACAALSRLLHRRNWQPFSRSQDSTSSLRPGEDLNSKPQQLSFSDLATIASLTREKPIMAPEIVPTPVASVILRAIPPYLSISALDGFLRTLPRLVQFRRSKGSQHFPEFYDLILDFEPGTDLTRILGDSTRLQHVTIEHYQIKIDALTSALDNQLNSEVVSKTSFLPFLPEIYENHSPIVERVATFDHEKLRPATCYICCDELGKEHFSTPCLNCRQAACYECVQRQFRQALEDFSLFPARCCAYVFHPDVSKGILSAEEHTTYRGRFEEWFDDKKMYCPLPTCSTFIPQRMLTHRESKKIECHRCGTEICLLCKQPAHPNRECKFVKEKEVLAVMESFGYKQCPRCGTAVGKMFGCAHIACRCGAHWCWSCERKIEECNAIPCDGSYDPEEWGIDHYDDNSDGSVADSEDEDIQNDIEEPIANDSLNRSLDHSRRHSFDLTHTTGAREPMTEVSQIETAIRPADLESINAVLVDDNGNAINLDNPMAQAWEATGHDFGDEPVEQDPLDTWGCIHEFQNFVSDMIPRYWITASNSAFWEQKEFNCVRCWKATRVMPSTAELEGKDEAGRTEWEKSSRGGRMCRMCRLVVCKRCKREMVSGKD